MSNAINHDPSHETLDVVLFYSGSSHVGFEARRVRASRTVYAGNTGVGIEAILGLAPSVAASQRQLLQFKLMDGDREFFVEGPVDLVSLPVDTIHPLPLLVAARTKLNGLRALAVAPEIDAGAVILLFDNEALMPDDADSAGV